METTTHSTDVSSKDSRKHKNNKKLVLCVPTVKRPFQQTLDAIRASVPLLDAAGWDHSMVNEVGNPYISAARATMLRKALDAQANVIVFIDHDVSWDPQDLLTLISTDDDAVCGTYRFKKDEEEYMGMLQGEYPIVRKDGFVRMEWGPGGFLKVTRTAVGRFMEAYPELCYGDQCAPYVDLFNHGAHKRVWWGEDAAFGRRWNELGGELWVIPWLNITHHTTEKAYPGNFHEYLLRQPGGSNSSAPVSPAERLKNLQAKMPARPVAP
jgi:glycosyltransferase involved in cell wall biosynthesis